MPNYRVTVREDTDYIVTANNEFMAAVEASDGDGSEIVNVERIRVGRPPKNGKLSAAQIRRVRQQNMAKARAAKAAKRRNGRG